jgi:hypothetical protein
MATATLDWSQCPAVESVPDRRSGAWVSKIPECRLVRSLKTSYLLNIARRSRGFPGRSQFEIFRALLNECTAPVRRNRYADAAGVALCLPRAPKSASEGMV